MKNKRSDRILDLDKYVFAGAVGVLGIIITALFFYGDEIGIYVDDILWIMTHKVGGVFILTQVVAFAFCIWLVFGRLKFHRIGGNEEKPQYGEFSWGAMIVCTGIAGATLVYAMVEPLWYLTDTPFGIEPLSDEAFRYAHMYGQFHWGILQWIPYVPTSILLAHYMFERNVDAGKMSIIFDEKHKVLRLVTDILAIFAIVGGVGTSMGMCVPLINKMLVAILGSKSEYDFTYILYILITFVFLLSVWRGFDKGIKLLSNLNVCAALCFIAVFALFVGPLKIIDVELNSVGVLLNNFPRMLFYSQSFGNDDFPQRWTVFYWGWFYAYLPLMALFIAKVSKGRTIRHITLGVCGYGSLGALLAFVVLGYYSLTLQKSSEIDLVSILDFQGKEATVMAILGTVPFPDFIKLSFLGISILFLATTIDSSAYVISMICSKKIEKNVDTKRWMRVLWAIFLAFLAIVLGLIEKLEVMQTLAVLTGFPMLFVVLYSCYWLACNRWDKNI